MNWGDLLLLTAGLTRADVEAQGSRCDDPPDPRVLPFPLGRTFWQIHERCRTEGRSTYRNDR